MNYVRFKVSIRLRPNSLTQFTETFDKDVLPILRKQAGFRDAITLGSEDSLHVTAISIGETKEQAEAYNTGGYLDVPNNGLIPVSQVLWKTRLTKGER